MLKYFFAQTPAQIKAELKDQFPDYRFRQLMHWVYERKVYDTARMSNLPTKLKDYLKEHYSFTLPKIDLEQKARDQTTKYRLELEDSSKIEMVIMPTGKKNTLCVSSQVGCARDCVFCATGKLGLVRNLETHEIVGQIMLAAALCQPNRLTNLVFMGMGEPLDNLDNVIRALSIIQAEETLAFSPRRITISTCGIPSGIRSLADSGIKTKLAVSLNAAIDEKRDLLMPINKLYPLRDIKAALFYYMKKSSFRITLEYVLIPQVNMGPEDIKALKKFAGDLSCKLNFIPYNKVASLPYRSPTEAEIDSFLKEAQSLHQAVTLRRSRGAEICGACGQLAGEGQQEI